MKVVALAGGTGSAKLLRGLAKLKVELTVVANVGDNFWVHGLYVCPDIDTAVYTLAGLEDSQRGWGLAGDSFVALSQLGILGEETWFKLGDRDLATHILRTRLLAKGKTLTDVSEVISRRLRLRARVLPVTDDPVETYVTTDKGPLHLQEFWVREKGLPVVQGVVYKGSRSAKVAESVTDAIMEADRVVLCPANPVTSIGPMLSIRGFVRTLRDARRAVALSPMIGRAPYSGPAAKLMKGTGLRSDSVGVAERYRPFLDAMIIDSSDAGLERSITSMGIRCLLTDTKMGSPADEERLARELLVV